MASPRSPRPSPATSRRWWSTSAPITCERWPASLPASPSSNPPPATATGGRPKRTTVPHERAVALGQYLAASGIDIALAPHLRLDHGFGQSTADLFGSLSAVPLIPIVINCVDRPLPTAARTAALGRAVGDFLRHEPPDGERVLVIGSGGISHAPPSLIPGARDLTEEQRQRLITDNIARAADAINPAWDEQFLATLASTSWARLAGLTAEDLAPAGTGGAEVRTWIAAAFTGGTPLSTVAYEPVTEWITGMGIAASDTLSAS